MRIGAHMSIAGGLSQMVARCEALGCETAQIFSRSPRGGKAREIPPHEAEAVKRGLEEAGIRPLVVHVPYFVNPASCDEPKREYTIEVIAGEIVRASLIDASYVVTHLGTDSLTRSGTRALVKKSLGRVTSALRKAIRKARSSPLMKEPHPLLLLENQSGRAGELGFSFEDIAFIIERLSREYSAGMCLDTCHAFTAGYDLHTAEGWDDTLTRLNQTVGLANLKVIHANDSKDEFGSRKDRHEHIGKGYIGLEGFAAMFSADRISHLPCILETPIKVPEDDVENLRTLKDLREKASSGRHGPWKEGDSHETTR